MEHATADAYDDGPVDMVPVTVVAPTDPTAAVAPASEVEESGVGKHEEDDDVVWKRRWQTCRSARKELLAVRARRRTSAHDASEGASLISSMGSWEQFLAHFRNVKELIRQRIVSFASDAASLDEHDSGSRQRTQTIHCSGSSGKTLHTALRIAMAYLSLLPDGNDGHEEISTLQMEAFECWSDALIQLILFARDKDQFDGQDGNDRSSVRNVPPTIQCAAARVLCNSVTNCTATTRTLLDRTLQTAPRPSTMVGASCDSCNDNLNPLEHRFNWVDLVLSTSSNRQALAAVVACLHNAICALSLSTNPDTDRVSILHRMASCPLLMATLLRHLVASLAIVRHTVSDEVGSNAAAENPSDDPVDDATEWIQFTISKLCRLGYLPAMYRAIAPSDHSLVPTVVVLPEHVVLLHCVRTAIEAAASGDGPMIGNMETNEVRRCFELGGESLPSTSAVKLTDKEGSDEAAGHDSGGNSSIVETHCFLANLYVTLRTKARQTASFNNRTDTDGRNDSSSSCSIADDIGLDNSAAQLALDILAEALTEDSAVAATVRSELGVQTALLGGLVVDMASVLDGWHQDNQDVRQVRDQSKLYSDDQRRVTTLIRLLGNLCFQCRQNQDRLRSILVPRSSPATTATAIPVNDPADGALSSAVQVPPMVRNGLHVLLSMTSMSHACFALREWVVVAIRAALDANVENQAVVAELEASAAVQSAELHDMGIRVNLDATTGSVSVTPLS